MASADGDSQIVFGLTPSGPKRKQKQRKSTGNGDQLPTPKSASKTAARQQPNQRNILDDNEDDSQIILDNNEDDDDDDDDDDMGAGGDGGNLDTFLSKNIPSMASATKVDAITKKRTYVTKTNKEWTVELKPLYKQLELMARKALLITCDKSLMQRCIDFCFASFSDIEARWIHDLAVRRFRINCNSWKSRYLRYVKSYIQKLDEKESVLRSCDSNHDLQVYFSERFSVDMFYTVCGWTCGWIDIEASIKEHPQVKVWCAYVFTEICVCVKHHLNWQRAYNSGKEIKKTQWDWQFVLNRFDNLYAGADEAWSNYRIQQLSWLHNASKANKITLKKEDRSVLQPKDDEYALKPDSKFLATLQYAPRSPSPVNTPDITRNARGNDKRRGRHNDRDDNPHNQKRRRAANTRDGADKTQHQDGSHGREEHNSQNSDIIRSRSRDSTMRASNSNVDSQNSLNRDMTELRSQPANNNKTNQARQRDILGKENQRVSNMLNKRSYNSHGNGRKTPDNLDEYDDDEEYGDNRLTDDDDDDGDDDDNEVRTSDSNGNLNNEIVIG